MIELNLGDQIDNPDAKDLPVKCLKKLKFKHVPECKLLRRSNPFLVLHSSIIAGGLEIEMFLDDTRAHEDDLRTNVVFD